MQAFHYIFVFYLPDISWRCLKVLLISINRHDLLIYNLYSLEVHYFWEFFELIIEKLGHIRIEKSDIHIEKLDIYIEKLDIYIES